MKLLLSVTVAIALMCMTSATKYGCSCWDSCDCQSNEPLVSGTKWCWVDSQCGFSYAYDGNTYFYDHCTAEDSCSGSQTADDTEPADNNEDADKAEEKEETVDPFQSKFVERINFWRTTKFVKKTYRYMVEWDENLATHAQEWADVLAEYHNCEEFRADNNEEHLSETTRSSSDKEGEALYSCKSYQENCGKVEKVVDTWGRQGSNYDGQPIGEGDFPAYASYTQLMWNTTTHVGCGVAQCGKDEDDKFSEVWVCRFSPPGNYQGVRPFDVEVTHGEDAVLERAVKTHPLSNPQNVHGNVLSMVVVASVVGAFAVTVALVGLRRKLRQAETAAEDNHGEPTTV